MMLCISHTKKLVKDGVTVQAPVKEVEPIREGTQGRKCCLVTTNTGREWESGSSHTSRERKEYHLTLW
jgi:hypothetical protein